MTFIELKDGTELKEELKKKVTEEDFMTTPLNVVNLLPLIKDMVLKLELLEVRIKKLEGK